MNGQRKFRKRIRQNTPDRQAISTTLREIGTLISRRNISRGLAQANQLLSSSSSNPHNRARVLALVGDSEFKRGAFDQAAGIYLQAASLCLDDHRQWLRPLVGHVRALLKVPDVAKALMMARHTLDLASSKRAAFDAAVSTANARLAQNRLVIVPGLPPRVSVVASRLGYLFLREGEPQAAKEFFKKAVDASPRGGCRARQGLARIALAEGNPVGAMRLAAQSIRMGKFRAKTISSWPVLISARRKLGGWMISQRMIDKLDVVPASVRARTILTIVRELRKNDMRQWRTIAHRWIEREGANFPAIAAEMRKMVLASWKVETGHSTEKRLAAEHLMRTPGISRNEWLAGAKEWVRASLWEGQNIDFDAVIQSSTINFGRDFSPKLTHSLALSCMMAKRHDLARPLLQRIINHVPSNKVGWARSAWALARMEESLGNHSQAADLYRQYSESMTMPLHLRLQAKLLWLSSISKAGATPDLLAMRSEIDHALGAVQDPDVLLNFARQVPDGDPRFAGWRAGLIQRGESLALQRLHEAQHPSLAVSMLFKLARRQVCDFERAEAAISYWEGLDDTRKDWLWSTQSSFWEYIGVLVVAYGRARNVGEVDAFAQSWLDDPASPPEGRIYVGIPYSEHLIQRGRINDALALLEHMSRDVPTHPLCAYAWYWKALQAHKAGDEAERDRCCTRLRMAQGVEVGLMREWAMDAKSHLLKSGLELNRIDPTAVNYTLPFLEALKREVLRDLEQLP